MKNKLLFRILIMILAAALVFTTVYAAFAAGPQVDEEKITPNAVILFDQETGQVIYSKNADEKIAPASTTKLLTTVLALENAELDEEVKVGNEVQVSGTTMGLEPGDTVTVETLIYGMLLPSGNDAAAAIAVHIAGSIEGFTQMMNDKAAEIGMKDSHFVTVSGKDAEGHLVTANDMMILTRYALQYELISEISQVTTTTRETVDGKRVFELQNTNRLIHSGEGIGDSVDYKYKYATGLKTGSTPNALRCLVATAEKDGQKLGVLIYGDASEDGIARWSVAKYLFEFGFDNYVNVDVSTLVDEQELRVSIPGAAVGENMDGKVRCQVGTQSGGQMITVSREAAEAKLTCNIKVDEGVAAPLAVGDVVGTIEYKLDGEVICSGQAVAAEAVMTQEEYDKLMVKPLEPVELEEEEEQKKTGSIWWWLLIPIALIAFIIIRAVVVRRQRRRYSRRRTQVATRRIYGKRRRRF